MSDYNECALIIEFHLIIIKMNVVIYEYCDVDIHKCNNDVVVKNAMITNTIL